MELLDIILNFDEYLILFIKNFGVWVYLILFFIVFAETGLVVTPFLPGDSLLFAVGAIAASGVIDIKLIIPLLFIAAVIGNVVNYHIGYLVGPKIFCRDDIPFLDMKNLDKTCKFYEKYGGTAIIISRFLPIFRTFVPFIAGIGKMQYLRFIGFNIIGAALWVFSFTLGGYYFGNLPIIKDNFELVIIGILIFSLLPTLVEFFRYKYKRKTSNVS